MNQPFPTYQSNSQTAVRTVLVVDDSLVQRRILALSLQKWGFEVSEAESGEEALAICKRMSPDIVLSDWMMPGMDGLEFCRQFRQLPRQTYGYFILLTSKTEKDSVARGLDCGADDFLPKPVNTTELRARIAAGERIFQLLDTKQEIAAPEIRGRFGYGDPVAKGILLHVAVAQRGDVDLARAFLHRLADGKAAHIRHARTMPDQGDFGGHKYRTQQD